MEHIIKPRAARKIYTFYGNVAKKYRHTYDKGDYKNNVSEALKAIYRIENGLLRRPPSLSWAGTTWRIRTSGIMPIPSRVTR